MSIGVGFYNQKFLAIKTGKDLIYESMIRILMTSPGERVMQPHFGAGMNQELFSLLSPDQLQDIAVSIHNSLNTYEPRVTVVDVVTEFTGNQLKVHVYTQREDNPESLQSTTFVYDVGGSN